MKVLILSYYFPPLGLGGTQRMAKFAKYLPEFGWQPTVITVKDIFYWARDESLLKDIQHIPVIRTGSLDPQRLLYKLRTPAPASSNTSTGNASGSRPSAFMRFINGTLLAFICVPDSKRLWNPVAKRAIAKLLRTEHFDAIISTGPPFSTHLMAAWIKQKYDLKWLADFRDDWAGGHVVHEPTFIQRRLNRYYQNKVVGNADAVISVSQGINDDLATNGRGKVFHIITNGYDPDEYPAPGKPNDFFTLVYCGVLSKFSDPQSLVQALAILKHKYPDTYTRLKVRIVGHDLLATLPEVAAKMQVADCLEYTGFLPHNAALQHVVDADALLLIATGTEQDTFIPGKTFEYLGTGKPILCISNVKDTSDLLKGYGPASVLTPDQPELIANALHAIMHNKPESNSKDRIFLEPYNRKRQTQKLAEILNGL